MKMNFLNVLNRKSTSFEIAEQIVLLEVKEKEMQKEKEKRRNDAKELRQKKLCGENVSESQIKEADLKVEDINLTIETIADSIANLKDKLRPALEAEKEGEQTGQQNS